MRRYATRSAPGADLELNVADYLNQWLSDGEWRPNTFRLRKRAIERHIVPHLGARRVADLDVDDLKLLFRKLKELDIGAATRRQVHSTLTSALNVLYRERKILFNPCSLIPAPRYEPSDKLVLDRHQVRQLIQAAVDRHRFSSLWRQRLPCERAGFGLLWECVDLEKRTVAVVRQLTDGRDGKPCLSMLRRV